MTEERITKTQLLIRFMRAGDWSRALALAATFRMLGPHRVTIKRAHECRVFPNFYRGLGRDPEAAVAAGIAALKQLYPSLPQRENHYPQTEEISHVHHATDRGGV
jgi:hypothetical protein